MDITAILNNKTLKPKEKTEVLSRLILEEKKGLQAVLAFAQSAKKDADKATCIEAMEFATKAKPDIANQEMLDFVTATLNEKAPRIKWESAKVIGNIAHLFPGKLDTAIGHLLTNTEHSGTVVRWAAAFALGEIIQSSPAAAKKLAPALKVIMEREEKSSIKKIYAAALKKANINP